MPKEYGHQGGRDFRVPNGFREQVNFADRQRRSKYKDRQALNKGKRSVRNVLDVLGEMSNITGVSCTRPNSEKDLNGKDIIVFAYGIGEVSIQVKSSRSRIRQFKKNMAEKHRIHPDHIDQFLQKRRILVVNGALKQRIQDTLTTQLKSMGPTPSWTRR